MAAQYFNDSSLHALAQRKCDEGCRDQLKEMAQEVIKTGFGSELLICAEMFFSRGYMKDDLVLTLVQVNQAILIFHEEPESLYEKISVLVPKAKNNLPVPSKVLVKMAALRIQKFLAVIDKHNRYTRKTIQDAKDILQSNPNDRWALQMASALEIKRPEEIRTVKEIEDLLDGIRSSPHKWLVEKMRKSFIELLAKPEFKDEHVSQSWDLILTGEIMKE